MHVIVNGKQVDVGTALTEYVEDTLNERVSKYFDNATDAQVTLSRRGHDFHVECTVHLSSGITVAASAVNADAHSCFDAACERIDKQLRRYKRRLKDHHSKERVKAKEMMAAQSYILAAETDEPEPDSAPDGEWHPLIIAESSEHIPDCSVGEAVMRMDLANVPAMMFHNSGTKGLNVVYRRPDGNIGWIDPKLEKNS